MPNTFDTEIEERRAPSGLRTQTSRFRTGRSAWWLFSIAFVALLVLFVTVNRSYYFAGVADQAVHPLHAWLRSSGSVGFAFALAGSGCILLNLAYLLRRFWVNVQGLGTLRMWMNLHVLTGLSSAAFILLHSAFTLRSVPGTIAATGLFIVISTGVFGRFVHALIPQTVEGKEKEIGQVQRELRDTASHLTELGVSIAFAPVAGWKAADSAFAAALSLFRGRLQLQREKRAILRDLAARPFTAEQRQLLAMRLPFLFRLRQEVRFFDDLRRLMSSWRFLHRWLALVMVGAVIFHVLLALWFSPWILGDAA